MNANFVITGDASQIDLPKKQKSGLIYALDRLKDIDGIGVVRLNRNDVIRHKLVKQIIDAFEDENNGKESDKD
jgi:phosphate starvation-inducible PhoH-like protein